MLAFLTPDLIAVDIAMIKILHLNACNLERTPQIMEQERELLLCHITIENDPI